LHCRSKPEPERDHEPPVEPARPDRIGAGHTGAMGSDGSGNLPGQTPTNYGVAYWNANANCYKYKQIIKVIDTQKPTVDNCPASPVEVLRPDAEQRHLWNEMYWWDNTIGSHDLCEGPTDLSSRLRTCARARTSTSATCCSWTWTATVRWKR
jgi:hypothetical protein